MFGKNFKKGMEAGAQPFEEKFRLQNEAIDGVSEDINKKLDGFNIINDTIIDDLTSIQKKRLYDLNTVVDINELDSTEKEFLIALIYMVSNKSDNTTELQKYFVRSIKSYLDITSPQVEVDLNSIENIKSIDSQKAILQTLMEFLFLQNANHKYIEEYKDILSYFSVNKRGITEIREKIDAIFNATGLEGIAENYGYVPEKDLEVEKIEEFEVEVTEEVEVNELEITKILYVEQGDTKVIKNSIVHMDTFITCEGTLIFDNCTLYYNVPNCMNKITLKEGAILEILDSKIICKGLDEDAFIKGEQANKVVFSKCVFYDCSYLLNLRGTDNTEFKMDSCEIINPGARFFEVSVKKGLIFNTNIKNPKNTCDNRNSIFYGYSESGEKFNIEECIVYSDLLSHDISDNDSNWGSFFSSKEIFNISNAYFRRCSFINVNNCISDSKEIIESEFLNCKDVIDKRHYNDDLKKVTNCIFKECRDIIRANNTYISNCQFEKCEGNIIDADDKVDIEFCEFYNIINKNKEDFMRQSSFIFSRRKESIASTLTNCIFNGVDLKDAFLISGNIVQKLSGPVAYIKDSVFRNCKTNHTSGKIINEHDHYWGLFNRRVEVQAILISNCTGLDKINKEKGYTDDVIIKGETSKGIKIGAQI